MITASGETQGGRHPGAERSIRGVTGVGVLDCFVSCPPVRFSGGSMGFYGMREWDGGKAWREGKRRSIDGKGGRKGSRYGEVPCLVGGSIGKGLSGRRAPHR